MLVQHRDDGVGVRRGIRSALPARRSASATAASRSRMATSTRTAKSSSRFSRSARSRRRFDWAFNAARRASCLIDF